MEGTQMQRGAFTPLVLDPTRLDAEMRGWIQESIRLSHRDLGTDPLGGPGACPGPDAPAVLQRYCVEGDKWELSAIGWLRLGTLVESHPRSRLFTHFSQIDDSGAVTWTDASESRGSQLRSRFSRSAGEPVAGVFAGSNYDGEHPSAIARLHDEGDPLSLPFLSQHLQKASFAPGSSEREHHLAMAMLVLGANIHVITDAGVPAHARGDAGSFMTPLSGVSGDRGDAMVEFVRGEYGLDLPVEPLPPGALPGASPLFQSFDSHIHGDDATPGLASFTATHFLSSGTLGPGVFLEPSLTAEEAATSLVPASHGLDPVEVEGAVLSPWPAERGYLKNRSGRALAAFDRDSQGRSYLYLDRAVLRDAASHLLPRTLETTTSLLDLVLASFAPVKPIASGLIHPITVPAGMQKPQLHVVHEDPEGKRRYLQRVPLRAGERQRLVGVPTPDAPESRIVLVLEWTTGDGTTLFAEQTLAPPAAAAE
jgi:hypothetical protein